MSSPLLSMMPMAVSMVAWLGDLSRVKIHRISGEKNLDVIFGNTIKVYWYITPIFDNMMVFMPKTKNAIVFMFTVPKSAMSAMFTVRNIIILCKVFSM